MKTGGLYKYVQSPSLGEVCWLTAIVVGEGELYVLCSPTRDPEPCHLLLELWGFREDVNFE